jgi:hypothetical protein
MTTQIWGTFSVADHLRKRPYVADVLLYDRLVVPVVPADPESRRHWNERDWRPTHQLALLDALAGVDKELVWQVPWDSRKVENFSTLMRMATAVQFDIQNLAAARRNDPDSPAFHVTRMILEGLANDLPKEVWAEAVPAYPSYFRFRAEGRSATPPNVEKGPSAAVFGWKFHVPDDPKLSDLELLREVAALSVDVDFRRKRQAFHDWRRNLKGVPDKHALEAFRTYLAEYTEQTRRLRIRTTVKYGFAIAALAAPIAPLIVPAAAVASITTIATWAGGFLGAGALVAERGKELEFNAGHRATAMFHDVRKRLGWREA